jgi:hypothetical protein
METLPLNDPHWLALRAAIDLRQQQTGAMPLAIIDLKQAKASGKLRTMRRNLATGEAELVPAPFWETYSAGCLGATSITIFRQTDFDKHEIDEYGNLVVERIDGWAWYVWGPDFETIWSSPAASAPVDQDDARDEPTTGTQEPTPRQRKPRKQGGGRRPKFEQGQLAWLRQRYHVAVKADPLLAKQEAAIPHVKQLAKLEFGIEAGKNTLLKHIIRPVCPPTKNNQQ